MDALETLRRLMPPTAESDASVDWAGLSRSWGKDLPSDYRTFIEEYGAGTIENYLVIYDPERKGAPPKGATGGMRVGTADAKDAWAREHKSPDLAGTAPELIAWGSDASADILCWDVSSDDPDRWPVLVRNRDDDLWRRYDCGMAEFLARTLRADFGECPLGNLSLWGKVSVTFLTWAEEERRLKAGLDPWTGEPDPYAGMFGG